MEINYRANQWKLIELLVGQTMIISGHSSVYSDQFGLSDVGMLDQKPFVLSSRRSRCVRNNQTMWKII